MSHHPEPEETVMSDTTTEDAAVAEEAPPPPLSERVGDWANVEILGHRSHVGKISEENVAGRLFLRIDPLAQIVGTVPVEYVWDSPVFYNPSSVFSLAPCDEQKARANAHRRYPEQRPFAALQGGYPIDDDVEDEPWDDNDE